MLLQITFETRIGLAVAGYLAEHSDDGWITLQTIATQYGLSPSYVSKTLEHLTRANILLSKIGVGGGFRLARSATDISLLDIFEVFEGPSEYTANLPERFPPENLFNPRLIEVLRRASEKKALVLGKASLKQMVG